MSITLYTKPACMQCRATKRALDKAGLDYTVVDISMDDEARDYVMALGRCSVRLRNNLGISLL